jgi:hypothetical protein
MSPQVHAPALAKANRKNAGCNRLPAFAANGKIGDDVGVQSLTTATTRRLLSTI